MRIQISIETQTKRIAEAAAKEMGYSSLASLLKVLSSNLARQQIKKQTNEPPVTSSTKPTIPLPPRSTPPPPSLEPVIVQRPTLPAPEKFTIWPTYASHTIWQTDPELYLFYIDAGIIR